VTIPAATITSTIAGTSQWSGVKSIAWQGLLLLGASRLMIVATPGSHGRPSGATSSRKPKTNPGMATVR
jgi:hypothetical protein